MEQGLNENSNITANMIAFGKILYDKNGKVKKLQESAIEFYNKEFAPMDEMQRILSLYHIWDNMDELKSLYDEGYNTDIVYTQCVTRLIDFYCCYHQLPLLAKSKLEKILMNSEFAERYHIKKLPPQDIVDGVLNCIYSSVAERIQNLEILYDKVVNACGGFNIGKFKTRSEITKEKV